MSEFGNPAMYATGYGGPPSSHPSPPPAVAGSNSIKYESAEYIVTTAPPNLLRPLGVWSTEILGCLEDCGVCCCACCCPCVVVGRVARITSLGRTNCCLACCAWLVLQNCLLGCLISCTNRSGLRTLYHLPEFPCNDCCVHCCCQWCGMSQEYRELMHRGWLPHLDYDTNIQMRQQTGGAPQHQEMTKL